MKTKSPAAFGSDMFQDRDFPLAVRRVHAHQPCRLHRHDFHELVVIIAGEGVHVTDTIRYPLHAGDVFVITGDTAHGYEETSTMSLVNILFRPGALGIPLADLGNIPGYHALFTVEPRLRQREGFQSRLRLEADELAEAMQKVALIEDELRTCSPGYRFLACSYLMALIGYLARCYSRTKRFDVRPVLRIGATLSYMEDRYADPMTVEQLASMAGMSQSSLMRAFRKIVGHPPIDHLIRIRICRACELLQQDDLRVTDVALLCGFNDSNYFTRAFKRIEGVSPRDYRRRAGV